MSNKLTGILAPAIYLLRWTALSVAVGVLAGSASALLLASLEWATAVRESHVWLIALLPLAGLATGLMYQVSPWKPATIFSSKRFTIPKR